jgi:hypothetical protein
MTGIIERNDVFYILGSLVLSIAHLGSHSLCFAQTQGDKSTSLKFDEYTLRFSNNPARAKRAQSDALFDHQMESDGAKKTQWFASTSKKANNRRQSSSLSIAAITAEVRVSTPSFANMFSNGTRLSV